MTTASLILSYMKSIRAEFKTLEAILASKPKLQENWEPLYPWKIPEGQNFYRCRLSPKGSRILCHFACLSWEFVWGRLSKSPRTLKQPLTWTGRSPSAWILDRKHPHCGIYLGKNFWTFQTRPYWLLGSKPAAARKASPCRIPRSRTADISLRWPTNSPTLFFPAKNVSS